MDRLRMNGFARIFSATDRGAPEMNSRTLTPAFVCLTACLAAASAAMADLSVNITSPAAGSTVNETPGGSLAVKYSVDWSGFTANGVPPVATLRFGSSGGGCNHIAERTLPNGTTLVTVPFAEIRAGMTGPCAQPDTTKVRIVILVTRAGNLAAERSSDFTLVRPPSPDLAVAVDPDFSTVWPAKFVVKNLGVSKSEDTLLRVKVEVLQGDLAVVKQNCKPRFTDFDEVVSELAPGASKTIAPPTANGPIRFRAGFAIQLAATPTPAPGGSPVQQVVACQFAVSAELAQNHNLNDTNRANDKLSRTIHVDVPLK
jgi:hypothetical protein